jgi:SM-20-related protein
MANENKPSKLTTLIEEYRWHCSGGDLYQLPVAPCCKVLHRTGSVFLFVQPCIIKFLSDYPKYKRAVSMWLNDEHVIDSAICAYRESLLRSFPHHIVIDGLFDEAKLDDVMRALHQPDYWETQNHTYSALYVDSAQWQKTSKDQRFVQRDIWRREVLSANIVSANIAQNFLSFLRGDEFIALLSGIFNVSLTDKNVAEPEINTNYFRLGADDFVKQHADDSPGREVCMLLYLNKEWRDNVGGELVFIGKDDEPIRIAPLYNRCVLFDPSSKGSEHWVETLNSIHANAHADEYRYNVTSWYWSE